MRRSDTKSTQKINVQIQVNCKPKEKYGKKELIITGENLSQLYMPDDSKATEDETKDQFTLVPDKVIVFTLRFV